MGIHLETGTATTEDETILESICSILSDMKEFVIIDEDGRDGGRH